MLLKNIKDTLTATITLFTGLGSSGTTDSIEKIKEIAIIIQQITESAQEPEMLKNIEKIRLIFKAIKDSSDNLKDATAKLQHTEIVQESKEAAKIIRSTIDSIGNSDDKSNNSIYNLKELIGNSKVLSLSIRDLVAELKNLDK
jgi:hypothetical protein